MNPLTERRLKSTLLFVLVVFAASAIIFSMFVLFTDLGRERKVTSPQARGMFTAFIHEYINEIHPQKPVADSEWTVLNIEFKNDNFAVVDAFDGQTRSRLEFVYLIESSRVRVMRINNVSSRDFEDAKLTLIYFLDFLHKGNYEEAAELYGGSISRLMPYGTGEHDVAVLLEGYCSRATETGQCMLFTVKDGVRDMQTGIYKFVIEYFDADDGSMYILDGDKSQFEGIVELREDGSYAVLTLPFD